MGRVRYTPGPGFNGRKAADATAPAVLRAAPAGAGYPKIRSLCVVGGFLDGFTADLADGLSCIIGARGTGKTTVLELVRYALDALPTTEVDAAGLKRIDSLIAQNLDGGRVEVAIETRDGLEYTVTRAGGEPPIVLGPDRQPLDVAVRNGGLFKADVFSQNEIESIADRPLAQLALLDKFEAKKIAGIEHEIRGLQHALNANAGQIGPVQEKLAALADDLAGLPAVDEKLRRFRGKGGATDDAVDEGHALKALRDRESRAVEALKQKLENYDGALKLMAGVVREDTKSILDGDVGTGPNSARMKAIEKAVLAASRDIDAALKAARARLAEAQAAVAKHEKALNIAHHTQELAFRRLIERHEAAQGQATERSRLDRERNELLAKKRAHDEATRRLEALRDERRKLLARCSDLRDRRLAIRQRTAEAISRALKNTVRVRVQASAYTAPYMDLLSEALRNSRLKPVMAAQKLVSALRPAELAALVFTDNAGQLARNAQLTIEQAHKVIDALAGSKVLFELETLELPDLPVIELHDGGNYKPTHALSTGQKCTAILPILLLDSENPLLIDQPEDNLDNSFVYECVVSRIRAIKARRQLIFATHNPNIPVLGDAGRVFVLESDGSTARLAASGTVDECRGQIVTLLEGGEEAFRKRQERYAFHAA
jgi:ABC-type lipoprotein export system ATPase subunit